MTSIFTPASLLENAHESKIRDIPEAIRSLYGNVRHGSSSIIDRAKSGKQDIILEGWEKPTTVTVTKMSFEQKIRKGVRGQIVPIERQA